MISVRRWVGWLLAAAAGLLLGLLLWLSRGWTGWMAEHLAAAETELAVWRALVAVGLIGGWPCWAGWLARHYRWSAARRRFVTAQRWRLAAWLLLLELLLVQNIAGLFWREIFQ